MSKEGKYQNTALHQRYAGGPAQQGHGIQTPVFDTELNDFGRKNTPQQLGTVHKVLQLPSPGAVDVGHGEKTLHIC